MKKFAFSSYLSSNLNIGEEEIHAIIGACKKKNIKKGDYLTKQGDYCFNTFFVESGLLRQFSIDNKGKEHILYFCPESWFVSDRESAYFKLPSKYFIQALEDTQVFLLDENFLHILSEKIPSFVELNNKLLHNHIRQLQNRITLLLSTSAEERYLFFIDTYPDILLRVPQIMVASYLGITPESLSRIRKELAQKNFYR
jgi:CRP-like cAMP-binding protein